MQISSYLKYIVTENKNNQSIGIFSICSANPFVLKTSLDFAQQADLPILIESTCNQVNQFGGYMNLKPVDFITFVKNLAASNKFPTEKIFLGGDHLGPSVWQNEPAASAMEKSTQLVQHYIQAGYKKIHLDASMPCKDDPVPLPKETVAEREAQLCRAAVDVCQNIGINITDLTFVVGSEVPTPGGSSHEEETLVVSDVNETKDNIELTKVAFYKYGLEKAWDQTFAFVVQPGVEFSDTQIQSYSRKDAQQLSNMIKDYNNLVFEAHSTDYQSRTHLKELVEDHFAILKVGPALTFAFREGLFALEDIENEIYPTIPSDNKSNLKNKLDAIMVDNPGYWENHYSNDKHRARFQRKYSLLDRNRYYWSNSEVNAAVDQLIKNLSSKPIPLSLVSQYFPDQVNKVKENLAKNHPIDLLQGKIKDVLSDYVYACNPGYNEVL